MINRKKIALLLFILLIATILLAVGYFAISRYFASWQLKPSSASNVSENFVYAMMTNDLVKAKKISDPSVWQEIEAWILNHAEVTCAKSPILNENHLFSSGHYNEKNNTWALSVTYSIPCGTLNYCFSIARILLEQMDGRWIVTGWGNMVEVQKSNCYQ